MANYPPLGLYHKKLSLQIRCPFGTKMEERREKRKDVEEGAGPESPLKSRW